MQALSTALLLLIQYGRTGFDGGKFNNCQFALDMQDYNTMHRLPLLGVLIRDNWETILT